MEEFQQYKLFKSKDSDTSDSSFIQRLQLGTSFDVLTRSITIGGMISTTYSMILLMTNYDLCPYLEDPCNPNPPAESWFTFETLTAMIYVSAFAAFAFLWYLELYYKLRDATLCKRLLWYTVKTSFSLVIGAIYSRFGYVGDFYLNKNDALPTETECLCVDEKS
eukprot:CAMPEP_0202724716 /NCGR_PEP_ID=MMETSP1385-20130828/175802_1 /ASSEMBLY_ACC=CAM_ASM_000861 /TAXON_ID=933848 /ORGANISM="Elphidium margaritaceum" /LENGTH=163 /DNA_ID=CAMNT_0049390417 /DNA_START=280 /DNA_END=768 /DNA_ORIENTATION=+